MRDTITQMSPLRHRYGHWYEQAACLGRDTDEFYPGDNERGPRRRRREAAAKQVCAQCSVSAQCLRWALQTQEPHGVWGGLSADERSALRTERSA
jgi:WhiB family transcriptional regulator, redox-sensing transcriptional regulator